MKRFLVIGIYEDDHQRWADEFEAKTAQAAAAMAEAEIPGLIVAGVVAKRSECLCGRTHQIEVLA